ncbi:major facilitator superfamily transporter [Ascobolus immersus RN42]|uniref:Major facilitator superfamily transporter n=1 Tax=Ascobolus immersus RN42 TaxID=1160509 RepID=A0A3N4J2A0_ASCIM|nr:major facilitator superfamily transporter [Ascobolus immersus RN42]
MSPRRKSGAEEGEPLLKRHPEATNDPLDPLNFSKLEKWTCLAIVMYLYFLFTYITTTTVPSFPQLQEDLDISYAEVNWTVAIPALGLTIGPLLWSSLADIYGRRMVFIVGTSMALVSTVWAAVVRDYEAYMAARFFQGLGVSPGATVGMAIINDLFFEHERGQKFGLWVLALDLGLVVGPLVGGFVTLLGQSWVQWVTAILLACLLLLEIFFLPETLYPRRLMLSRNWSRQASSASQRRPASGDSVSTSTALDLPRTRNLPFLMLTPIPGVRHPKLWDPFVRTAKTFLYPNVSVPIVAYCFLWYWWVLSVVTYIPAAYPIYAPHVQGLFFLGLIVGTLFSETFCSGSVSDKIMQRHAMKNNNKMIPEARLWLAYPACVMTSVGLCLWGVSVDQNLHWMVGQSAFFLFAAGIQMGNTCFSSYIVDCYPFHGMSMVTFYSVILNLSAFINPFFIAYWVEAVGYSWAFSTQALITLIMIPVVFVLQRYGGSWREKVGEPDWVSSEYTT